MILFSWNREKTGQAQLQLAWYYILHGHHVISLVLARIVRIVVLKGFQPAFNKTILIYLIIGDMQYNSTTLTRGLYSNNCAYYPKCNSMLFIVSWSTCAPRELVTGSCSETML